MKFIQTFEFKHSRESNNDYGKSNKDLLQFNQLDVLERKFETMKKLPLKIDLIYLMNVGLSVIGMNIHIMKCRGEVF